MKKLLFILFIPFLTLGQELHFIEKTALNADFFIGTDSYKNTYYVKDNSFYKQEKENVFVFNDLLLGNISSIDIINPLNIVVYYREVNTVVLLDNQLSEIERIEFNTQPELIITETVTNAGNNELWIFNTLSQQLELFNYRTKTIRTHSQPIEGTLIDQSSNFNFCYLLTEENLDGYNRYGSLLSNIKTNGLSKIYINEAQLIVQEGNHLFDFSEKTLQPIIIPMPEILIKDLQVSKDFIYIYDGKYLYTFSINQPK
ncbi:MAG: hypothetical protein ACWA45_09520 [Flavobacteriales bacterium]